MTGRSAITPICYGRPPWRGSPGGDQARACGDCPLMADCLKAAAIIASLGPLACAVCQRCGRC